MVSLFPFNLSPFQHYPSLSKIIAALSLLIFSSVLSADSLDQIIELGQSRIKSAISSQQKIDQLHDQIEKMRNEIPEHAKVLEGLTTYNKQMNKLVAGQNQAKNALIESMGKVKQIERQILPLMVRMITGMDEFVALDLPFMQQQRMQRQQRIKKYMSNNKLPAAERTRLVLGLYSEELTFGKTISTYIDTVKITGEILEADLLRIGRIALYFLTRDEKIAAIWDKNSGGWKLLDKSHNDAISRAINIAKEKLPPDLLRELPLLVQRDNN